MTDVDNGHIEVNATDELNAVIEASSLYQLTCKVYDGMAEKAQDTVFRGSTTKLFTELRVPNSYYARIMRQLQSLGYAEQVERGRSAVHPSIWKLWSRPSPETWKISHTKPLTEPVGSASLTGLSKRVEAIEKRLGGLDVVLALSELTQEIQLAQEKIDGLIAAQNSKTE